MKVDEVTLKAKTDARDALIKATQEVAGKALIEALGTEQKPQEIARLLHENNVVFDSRKGMRDILRRLAEDSGIMPQSSTDEKGKQIPAYRHCVHVINSIVDWYAVLSGRFESNAEKEWNEDNSIATLLTVLEKQAKKENKPLAEIVKRYTDKLSAKVASRVK